MADGGIGSDQAAWIAVFTAVGGAGFIGKFWDHIFGGRAVMEKTRAEAMKALSDMFDAKTKTLIDGYEKRVSDLTDEIHNLRAEIISLRQALDAKTRETAAPAGFG